MTDDAKIRPNKVRLFLHTELQTALNGKSGARKIPSMRYMLLVLTEHCKDVLDPETYKMLHDEYIKTDTTLRKEKEARERERREKLEAKEKIQEKKVEAYSDQQNLAREKFEKGKNKKTLKEIIHSEEYRKLTEERNWLRKTGENPELLAEIKQEQARMRGES